MTIATSKFEQQEEANNAGLQTIDETIYVCYVGNASENNRKRRLGKDGCFFAVFFLFHELVYCVVPFTCAYDFKLVCTKISYTI